MKYKIKEFIHCIKENLTELRYYSFLQESDRNKGNNKCMIICMVDGKFYQGGLCDRFKGIISAYAYCKQKNIPFRINYNYPFLLSDYLQSNQYDWSLRDRELRHSIWNSKILYMVGEYRGTRLLNLNTKKQVHFYCNRNLLDVINRAGNTSYNWGQLFKELFKPTPILQKNVQHLMQSNGKIYNAAVFRFQNLLGDFPEYDFKPLASRKEKDALIGKCIKSLKELKKQLGGDKMLVTSDSVTFLKQASLIEGVFTIPGRMVHIGCSEGASFEVYLKSFVDFFMLANSKSIYSLGTNFMYPSEFPLYASMVNNVPFKRILIE